MAPFYHFKPHPRGTTVCHVHPSTPMRVEKKTPRPHRVTPVWVLFFSLASLLWLNGCGATGVPMVDNVLGQGAASPLNEDPKVVAPPLIPVPPDGYPKRTYEGENPLQQLQHQAISILHSEDDMAGHPETQNTLAGRVLYYDDLLTLSETDPQDIQLKKAVISALEKRVLEPAAKHLKFNRESSISRGQFAMWLAKYKELIPIDPPEPTFQDVDITRPEYIYIETIVRANWMNFFQMGGDVENTTSPSPATSIFKPDTPLTRSDLCKIYAWVTEQDEEVESMGGIAAGETTSQDFGSNRPLERIRDYDKWSRELRPYAAIAFRDGLFRNVFSFTKADLFQQKGLEPEKPVTREEALLFLQSLP